VAGVEPVVSTARLDLRPFVPDDLDALCAMYGDPEVMRYIGYGVALTHADTLEALGKIIADHLRNGFGLLAAVLRSSGEVIGRCGHHRWEIDGVDELEVGWMLARPYWGHGYATEAALALRDHGFEVLGRDHLVSLIQPANRRSVAVAERIGARRERGWAVREIPVDVHRVDRPG
jgi:RimJ/RimL family protein N-acetyltransferase